LTKVLASTVAFLLPFQIRTAGPASDPAGATMFLNRLSRMIQLAPVWTSTPLV